MSTGYTRCIRVANFLFRRLKIDLLSFMKPILWPLMCQIVCFISVKMVSNFYFRFQQIAFTTEQAVYYAHRHTRTFHFHCAEANDVWPVAIKYDHCSSRPNLRIFKIDTNISGLNLTKKFAAHERMCAYVY